MTEERYQKHDERMAALRVLQDFKEITFDEKHKEALAWGSIDVIIGIMPDGLAVQFTNIEIDEIYKYLNKEICENLNLFS